MTRGFTLPSITLAQVMQGIKEWNVLPFMAASACCLYLLFMRWIWYIDLLGGAAFIVGFAICIVFLYANADLDGPDLKSPAFRLKCRIARQFGLLVPMIALFYINGSGNEGYRFNYATGQSGMTRSFLRVSPFSQQPVFFVYTSQHANVDVDVLTQDRIPLRCHVSAGGIVLDERDLLKLEATILNLDPSTEPQSQIGGAVMGSLASAAARVLSAKTSVEVGQERQFLIPYSIGTPLGDTFQKYMLQWKGGDVRFSCRVRFSN